MNKTNILVWTVSLLVVGGSIYWGTINNSVNDLDTTISIEKLKARNQELVVAPEEVVPTTTPSIEEPQDPQEAPSVQEAPTQSPTKPTIPTKPTPAPTVPAGPKTFTQEQVMAHNTEASCYTVIDGKVYDVSAFVRQHPGGSKEILRLCGKDGTRAFNSEHSKDMDAHATLAGFQIGVLAN